MRYKSIFFDSEPFICQHSLQEQNCNLLLIMVVPFRPCFLISLVTIPWPLTPYLLTRLPVQLQRNQTDLLWFELYRWILAVTYSVKFQVFSSSLIPLLKKKNQSCSISPPKFLRNPHFLSFGGKPLCPFQFYGSCLSSICLQRLKIATITLPQVFPYSNFYQGQEGNSNLFFPYLNLNVC